MRNTKAQQITLTALFVLFIFSLVLTLFFDELFINPRMNDQRYRHLQREASRAVTTLASDGYPNDWDNYTVQRSGVLTNGIYNETKVKNLANIPYDTSKDYLGITSNYFLNITNNDTTTIIGLFTNEEELIATNPSYLTTQTKTVTSSTGIATITIYTYRGTP